jgi:signal transduction histidine kinase
LALLRAQLEQNRITVLTSYETPLPLISGDSDRLKQLFLNVLVNAVEAMPSGGELDVRVSLRRDLGPRAVVVEVQDSGVGIPQASLAKIFDPFVTTKERGSGLGLSICRGIADSHRATIYATNSIKGRGAMIVIEFPVSTASSGHANGVAEAVIGRPSTLPPSD